MPLALKLPPRSRVILNGCVVRNADRVQTVYVENKADVILEKNLVQPDDVDGTVSGRLYELLQTALLAPEMRDAVRPDVQTTLAQLIHIFQNELRANLMEAATHVSVGDWYSAMRQIKPVWDYEAKLMQTYGKQPEALVT